MGLRSASVGDGERELSVLPRASRQCYSWTVLRRLLILSSAPTLSRCPATSAHYYWWRAQERLTEVEAEREGERGTGEMGRMGSSQPGQRRESGKEWSLENVGRSRRQRGLAARSLWRPSFTSYTLVSTGNRIERTTQREFSDVTDFPLWKFSPYLYSLYLSISARVTDRLVRLVSARAGPVVCGVWGHKRRWEFYRALSTR